MQSEVRRFRRRPATILILLAPLLGALSLLTGCASPATPRPPSLHLPEPVKDLAASRTGELVVLRFTVPSRTTDGLPLLRSGSSHGTLLHGTLCRQTPPANLCQPIHVPDDTNPLPVPRVAAPSAEVTWTDRLPPDLLRGTARPVAYRLELRNEAGGTAGYSDPAYVASGAAPPQVTAFEGQGVRSGLLLHWQPEGTGGEVLLKRTDLDFTPAAAGPARKRSPATAPHGIARLAPGKEKRSPDTVWLQAEPGNPGAKQTIDGTVTEGVRYRYVAVRQILARVGGRTLILQSAPSDPVEIAWHDVYPPPVPQGLTAARFANPQASSSSLPSPSSSVDLIWEPVNDPRVTGYVVERAPLSAAGQPQGAAESLTAVPLTSTGFHDASPAAGQAYRYEVRAVDEKGNRSPAAITTVASTP